MIPGEVVQVELIDTWWESLLPISAIVISLISVGLTLWFRFSERLKVSIKFSWITPVSDSQGLRVDQERLAIEATNRSRDAVTELSSMRLELPNGKALQRLEFSDYDHELPASIGPGQSVMVTFDAYGLGSSLLELGEKGRWVRPVAECGHKTFKGRKDSKLVKAAIQRVYNSPRHKWGK